MQPFRQKQQDLFEDQADDADHEDGDDDVLDLEVVPLVPHPEADADAAGEHFRGDDDQPGGADRQADAGEHVRQHAGEEDLGDDLPFGEVEHARDVEVVLRHALHTLRGVHDHRPDRADEDRPGRRRVGALENQQADRQPGQRRNGAQQADQRIDDAREQRKATEQESRRDADQRREAEENSRTEQTKHIPEKITHGKPGEITYMPEKLVS